MRLMDFWWGFAGKNQQMGYPAPVRGISGAPSPSQGKRGYPPPAP
ncbi:unnamed protein product, partial [marine sediment metagenome]